MPALWMCAHSSFVAYKWLIMPVLLSKNDNWKAKEIRVHMVGWLRCMWLTLVQSIATLTVFGALPEWSVCVDPGVSLEHYQSLSLSLCLPSPPFSFLLSPVYISVCMQKSLKNNSPSLQIPIWVKLNFFLNCITILLTYLLCSGLSPGSVFKESDAVLGI